MAELLFQSLWIGGRLPALEETCIRSFVASGHRYRLYAYEDVPNVPSGCEVSDARNVLPKDRVFRHTSGEHAGSVAGFSDLFRFKLLQEHGGWWVDTDVICLSDVARGADYVFAEESAGLYGTAVLKAPRGSALVKGALEKASAVGEDFAFGEIGPSLLTATARELGLEEHAWESHSIYALPWHDALAVFDPNRREEIQERTERSTFLHLWTSILRLANVLKDVSPPPGSFLFEAHARFGTPLARDVRYDWEDMGRVADVLAEYWKQWDQICELRAELTEVKGQEDFGRPGGDPKTAILGRARDASRRLLRFLGR